MESPPSTPKEDATIVRFKLPVMYTSGSSASHDWLKLDEVDPSPMPRGIGPELSFVIDFSTAATATKTQILSQNSHVLPMSSNAGYNHDLAKPSTGALVRRSFYRMELLAITTLDKALDAMWSDNLHTVNPDSVFAGWAQQQLNGKRARHDFRNIMLYILLSPRARDLLLLQNSFSKRRVRRVTRSSKHHPFFQMLEVLVSMAVMDIWRKIWPNFGQMMHYRQHGHIATRHAIWRHAVGHFDCRLSLPQNDNTVSPLSSTRVNHNYHESWEGWSHTYSLDAALEALVREQTSSSVLLMLREYAHANEGSQTQNVADRFKEMVTTSSNPGRLWHVLRLLHVYYRWTLQQKWYRKDARRLHIPAGRKKLRDMLKERIYMLKRRINSSWKHLQSFLQEHDGLYVSAEDPSAIAFLVQSGFTEILRRDIPRVSTISQLSSKLHCIEVLTELIAAVLEQLRQDVDAEIGSLALPEGTQCSVNPTAKREVLGPTQTTSIALDTILPAEGNRSYGRKDILSPAAREDILSKLSPTLQLQIKNGVLTDMIKFPMVVRREKPDRWLLETLASLIEFELEWPKKTKHSHADHRLRRQKLSTNADVVRKLLSTTFDEPVKNDDVDGYDNQTKSQLRVVKKWRRYHQARLKFLTRSQTLSRAESMRKMQIEAVIREAGKRIKILRSRALAQVSQKDKNDPCDALLNPDPIRAAFSDLETLVMLRPVSLPDSLQHQLSRELLDSLNEACFVFGQREASSLMQDNHWSSPEVIDLPVFLFSLSLYPRLFHHFVAHDKVFARLRSFRNHYAHGSGSMSIDDITLTLDDVDAVAKLLQSPGVTIKNSEYRTLLADFKVSQMEHINRVSSLALQIIYELKCISEAGLQRVNINLQGPQGNDRAAAEQGVIQQVENKAAKFKEAWEDALRDLAQHTAQKLALSVGEAQLRRLLRVMGPGASAVLSKIQKEYTPSQNRDSDKVDVERILKSLERKLTHSLITTTTGEPIERTSRFDNQKNSGSISPSNNRPLGRSGSESTSYNNTRHSDSPEVTDYPTSLLEILPQKTPASNMVQQKLRRERTRLGKLAANVRRAQTANAKAHGSHDP